MKETKRVLIVGATSGLGRLLAERYIREGNQVGIVGRREHLLNELSEGQDKVHTLVADVTDVTSVAGKLSELRERMGGMDLLILCSGVGKMNPLLDYAQELPTIDTNVRGWTAVVDWAFASFCTQGYGQLAAISSVAGIRGLAPAPAYAASKAYQIHYLEALRQRARVTSRPIYVTDIRPGFIRTPLLSHPEKLFWVDEPYKAVRAIYRAICARKPKAVVTSRWAFLAPWMRLAPEWLVARILAHAG